VDALVGEDVLPQRGHVEVAQDRGVERVPAPMGEGGGVGGLAAIGGGELLDRDHVHAGQVITGGVHHHGGVDPLEGPLPRHEDLSAPALLGRCPQEHDAPADLLGQRGGGQAGAEARGGDEVVPAGVAQAGQGVVLAQHGHGGAGGPGSRHEGRVEPVGAPLDGDAGLLHEAGQQVVGEVLRVVRLGVLVDLVRRLDELVGAGLHLGLEALLEGGQVHRRSLTVGAGALRRRR
jgi:hypothetical protein